MIENEPPLQVPEWENTFTPEHVAQLATRLIAIASEVDRPSIEALDIKDFGDDDVDILEKFTAWSDGNKEALTNEDIQSYIKARDISEKVAPDSPNLAVKRAVANVVANKTPEIWM